MTGLVFDARIAARYDDACGERNTPAVVEATCDLLEDLAGDAPVLEFAIGTGRIGLPLSQRGVEVHGLEISQPMVDQMRSKPGGDQVPVTIGDMATTRVAGSFGLVYLVFNTVTNLATQAEQAACFANAAAHLRPGGHFLVEVLIPGLRLLGPGKRYVPFDVGDTHLGFDEYHVAEQRLVSHHYSLVDGHMQHHGTAHRYAWPAEYDLMAQMAGMTLASRWSDWDRTAFDDESTGHISVWSTPPTSDHLA